MSICHVKRINGILYEYKSNLQTFTHRYSYGFYFLYYYPYYLKYKRSGLKNLNCKIKIYFTIN